MLRSRRFWRRVGPSTQRDPIGLAGGLNQYGYAGGDPVNFSDPFGLKITFLGKNNMDAMRRLLRGSATFRAMVNALQTAPVDIEVRAPQEWFEVSALNGTDTGAGAMVKISGDRWAALINPDLEGDRLAQVVAHEVAHLAGEFAQHTGVASACAKEGECVRSKTNQIYAELVAFEAERGNKKQAESASTSKK